MGWKVIRNSEPSSRSDSFSGNCPKFDKTAIITVYSAGNVQCKTDLQKTYHTVGYKCSLLEGTTEANFSSCMETCPLVPKKFL